VKGSQKTKKKRKEKKPRFVISGRCGDDLGELNLKR
jgi:hypothetical protein